MYDYNYVDLSTQEVIAKRAAGQSAADVVLLSRVGNRSDLAARQLATSIMEEWPRLTEAQTKFARQVWAGWGQSLDISHPVWKLAHFLEEQEGTPEAFEVMTAIGLSGGWLAEAYMAGPQTSPRQFRQDERAVSVPRGTDGQRAVLYFQVENGVGRLIKACDPLSNLRGLLDSTPFAGKVVAACEAAGFTWFRE